MNSGFRMELILEYSKVFDDKPHLDELLSGISRNTLLNMSAFFLGFDNQNSKYHKPKEFISMFFQAKNNEFANDVYDKIKVYQQSTSAEITIPYVLTSLTLFEYAFKYLGENETLTQAEIEINVFKAYLLINEVHVNKSSRAEETVKGVVSERYMSELIFTMTYADSDLMNFDPPQILISQIVKSIMLFEMLESDVRSKSLLAAFLKYFECATWKDYLKAILPAVLPCYKKGKEAHVDIVVTRDANYEQNTRFLDRLIISNDESLVEYDFTSVRANPIYKVEEGVYRIVFPLFAMEMLHKGLYFKLNEINKTLTREQGGFSNFRSYYCDNFSENHLLYETIARMYGKCYKKFSGQQMKEAGLIAEPDFYIRNGNKIFLFESKDVLIPAAIKTSFDYGQLETALKEKFYFVDKGEGKIANKAILQIVNNVKKVIDKALIVDHDYNEKTAIIYPILITHHHQYDVAGLNNILKEWFSRELQKLSSDGYDTSRVRPLTLINIDDLLYYQDLFLNKQIKLEELIDGYHTHTTFDKRRKYRDQAEVDDRIQATLVPFRTFISQYVGERGLHSIPKILHEKGFTVFD